MRRRVTCESVRVVQLRSGRSLGSTQGLRLRDELRVQDEVGWLFRGDVADAVRDAEGDAVGDVPRHYDRADHFEVSLDYLLSEPRLNNLGTLANSDSSPETRTEVRATSSSSSETFGDENSVGALALALF